MPDQPNWDRLLELIRSSPANYEYFFKSLDAPDWLDFLVDAGFFTHPPAPERGEDWVRFPGWAESDFLLRIADRAEDKVFAIVERIPATENPRVHEDVIEIATKLRPNLAARLARREARWLSSYDGHLMSLPQEAGKLLAYLAQARQTKAALEFAGALMRIRPAPDREGAPSRQRAVALMNEWSYNEIIKAAWPALAASDPPRAVTFLADRLDDVVRLGFIDPGGFDTTYVWRPAIENHAQNLGHSLLDTLIEAVRDTAINVARDDVGLAAVLEALGRYDRPIFRRVSLFLITQLGDEAAVSSALTDPTTANEIAFWHEYSELLRTRFGGLSEPHQQAVLRTIEAGPRGEDNPSSAQEDEKSDRDKADRRWKLLRYSLIAEDLPPNARASYDALVNEFGGEPEHPSFLSYTSSWQGPTSPLSPADLEGKSIEEIASFMRGWEAGDRDWAPSSDGLGRVVEQIVTERPAEFAASASSFIGLDPDYVSAVIGGLEAAIKAKSRFRWAEVLSLLSWAVDQPRAEPEQEPASNRWGWTRQRVASLLSRSFQEPDVVPIELRGQTWALLRKLTDDPDPTPERERPEDDDSQMDPFTLSINTVRGEAMHAVVRYVLWVEKTLGSEFSGMASTPEAAEILEAHLDPTVDPSPAVRSVYGQWFAQFVRLDPEWAAAVRDRVFSTAEPRLFAAAWDTYIVWTPPWNDVYDVLAPAYRAAVAFAEPSAENALLTDNPRERLGQHLFIFRIRGKLERTADREDLFTTFWTSASPDVRQAMLISTGQALERTRKDALTADELERLMQTWDELLERSDAPAQTELAGFGAWLGAEVLDPVWLSRQARAVLDLGVHLEPAFGVYEALPRLAHADPKAVVAILRGMVSTDPEGWSLAGYEEEARNALKIALASPDEQIRDEADALIEWLGARGMSRFRDLKQ